jgi:hypothetical protein
MEVKFKIWKCIAIGGYYGNRKKKASELISAKALKAL